MLTYSVILTRSLNFVKDVCLPDLFQEQALSYLSQANSCSCDDVRGLLTHCKFANCNSAFAFQ